MKRIVLLCLLINNALGQSTFKLTYPYKITALNIDNNKLRICDDQGFKELDAALNLTQEYRLPTPFANLSCTYGTWNTNPQTRVTRYKGANGFYVSSSVCLPTAGPNYFNRVHLSKVNYEDTLAVSIIDGRYHHYCSSFLSANRLCLLSLNFNSTADLYAYDYNLSRKWSFSLPYPSSLTLCDSLNFAINLNDSVFVVVDSSSNFIHKKKHTTTTLKAIKKLDQNKNLICGQINQGKGIVVCMTDSGFNPVWSKQFFMSDSAKNTVADVFVSVNEEIYITTNREDSTSFILKLDNQGNVLVYKQLESTGQKTRIGNITQLGQQIILQYVIFNGTSTTTNKVIGLNQDLSSSCVNMYNISINSAGFNFNIEDDTSTIPVTYYSGNTYYSGTPGFIASLPLSVECSATGISEPTHEGDLKIFPNPCNENLKVLFSDQIDRITITNLMGTEVKSVSPGNSEGEVTMETSELASGIYMITVYKTNRAIAVKKLIVTKD